MNLCFLLCFLLFVCRSSVTSEEEPMCTKFMYDKQMIETMVRMEVKMDQWDKDRKAVEEHHKEELDQVVRAQNVKLESLIADLNDIRSDVRNMKSDMDKEAEEEQSISKFKYDKQMLETMVRMEAKMEEWDKERKTFEENVLSILEHRREEMDEVFHTQTGKLEKERNKFEKNVLSMLEDRQKETNGKLETLIAEFKYVRDDVRNTTADIEILEDDRREEMNVEFQKQNGKLETLIADYNEIRDDVRNKTAEMEIVAESIKDTPKVAFNAYTMSSGSYPVNKVLVFPNVLLNEGGGYNNTTGVFTAPVSGLYQFHVHVCHWAGYYMIVSIVHGTKQLAITTEYESNLESCSSVSAPALVNEDEHVFIKSQHQNSRLYADAPHRWPSFSGFLVHE